MPLVKILDFLEAVGIKVIQQPVKGSSFLPGLQLENGQLIVDSETLLYPGDILHEAGHLATMPPEVRETMSDNLPDNDLHRGGEMMALAWSYAAAVHLQLNPAVVFHPFGYKGGSENLIRDFAEKKFLGLPLLQWAGMAYDEQRAKQHGLAPYPHMIRWLREY